MQVKVTILTLAGLKEIGLKNPESSWENAEHFFHDSVSPR